MQARFFRTPAEFRRWLERHHAEASELPVGLIKKGSHRRGITYAQALDEALCFGWIDGVTHGLDDERYVVRFTPRRRGSNWSDPNIERVRRLTEEGRMHPAGLEAFERRKEAGAGSVRREAAAFDGAAERRFRANRAAWRFWQAQPPGYRRTATWWV
ncbi:MAG TPA: bacteriocin-protection protein, partial [Actinomycetota bacterium]|nr:bacteriocin-protection protein [Actinomycetota bacterium]